MRKLFGWALLILGIVTCQHSRVEQKEIEKSPTEKLDELYAKRLDQLLFERSEDGWIGTDSCDAALSTGTTSCAQGFATGLNYRAAEYPNQPGRFNRRPNPFCEAGQGSQTSWSRDMGTGLMAYAWCNGDLALLEDHASYGASHYWKMGEPLADGRVLYTPNMVGLLYQLIYALGGESDVQRNWPSAYPQGLTDYEAHLQMLHIWLRGEVSEARPELLIAQPERRKTALLDVSAQMFERIKEHAAREPRCPFYQYLSALYDTGDMTPVIELLLSEQISCEYFHGESENQHVKGEWLFAASLVRKKLT